MINSREMATIPLSRRSVLHRQHADWATFPFWRIVYIAKGAGRYEWLEGNLDTKQGDYLLLRPGRRRILVTEPLRLSYLPFVSNQETTDGPTFDPVVLINPIDHEREIMQLAFRDASLNATIDGDRERCLAQIRVMLTVFKRHSLIRHQSVLLPESIREVAACLTTHPEERINVPAMARRTGFSVPHFSREFRRHFGLSPAAYAIRARLNAACELLTTEKLSVKETAYSLNYPSPFAFSRQFRQFHGCAPGAYRRQAIDSLDTKEVRSRENGI